MTDEERLRAGYGRDGEEKATGDLTAGRSCLVSQAYGGLLASQGQPTTEVHSERPRSNKQKLQEGKFQLYIKKTFFHHSNGQILLHKRLSREELGSSSLETSRAQLDTFLGNLPCIGPAWSSARTRNLQRFLPFSINLDRNESGGWEQMTVKEEWNICQ